jgi:hypothetical protein
MGRPYYKPDRAEQEERVAFTVFLLSRHARKSEIKRLLKARFGVSARTCERLLARARGLLRESTGAPPQEHRLRSYAFYLSVIRDPAATLREKMLAQKRIDKLLGLELRGKAVEPGEGTEGGPDPLAAVRQQALQDPVARELMVKLAERLGGLGAGEAEGGTACRSLLAHVPEVTGEVRPRGRPPRRQLAG